MTAVSGQHHLACGRRPCDGCTGTLARQRSARDETAPSLRVHSFLVKECLSGTSGEFDDGVRRSLK
jgi:hypothetical protein